MKEGEKKNQKSKITYVDSSVSENSSTQILASKTIIHNEKTYYIHPIHTKYGCSKDGYIINKNRLIPRKGRLHFNGYLNMTVISNEGKVNSYWLHRFIWEAINQKIIPDGYQIHHVNNDKQDNSIENLALVTRQQNMIYANNERCGKKIEPPQNVPIKCDVFYYHPIYTNFGANKDGQIFNKKTKRCSIGNLLPSGYRSITLKQIGLPKKHFYVHRLVYEIFNGPIPDKMEINHIDSNKQNNCIKNLELMTRSENAKHAHEARKYKTKIEIKTEKPIKSIKMDIELEESDDEFTEDEKQKIDKKYNAIINKIKNGKFPYKKQLQEHLPNIQFW